MDSLVELTQSSTDEITTSLKNKTAGIFRSIVKATKSRIVYPSSSRLPQQFLDELYGCLCEALCELDTISYNVAADKILYANIEIYRAPNKTDNFALPFFRDGFKSFEFRRGITHDELAQFIEVLSQVIRKSNLDDDLATLFWESNFSHISYELMDDFLNIDSFDYGLASLNSSGLLSESDVEKYYRNEYNLNQSVEDSEASPKRRAEQSGESAENGAAAKNEYVQNIKEFSEQDNSIIAKMISEDESFDANENIIKLVFEMLILEPDRAGRHEALEIIGKVHDDFIKACDFNPAGIIFARLKELKGILSNFNDLDHDTIQEFVENFATPERIRLMINSLNRQIDIDHGAIVEYLEQLPRQVIPQLVSALGELSHFSGRRAVCRALVTMAANDIESLAKGIEDPRWFVVRNTVMIMGEINNPKVLRYFRKTIHHPEPRVRKETLAAVARMNGDEVCDFLIRGLDENDEKLRLMALDELVRRKATRAFAALERFVCHKNFKNNSEYLIREFLKAFALLGGPKAYKHLKKMAKRKSFFSSDKRRILKVNALLALGQLAIKDSLKILEKFSKSRQEDLAKAALQALKTIARGELT